MGIVNFGVPEKEVDFLRKKLGIDVFVEGGTYKGGTAKLMSKQFKKVYTIEKSNEMFDVAKENLKHISNITMLKGDTRDYLQTLLDKNNDLFFWLDAHWSGGITYGEEDECPLIMELEIIFSYTKNYIILIDDARLFLAPPPIPHNLLNWPSLMDIMKVLPENWELLEFEDVIYLFPRKISKEFKYFLQNIITNNLKKNKKTLIEKILNRIGVFNC